jgi:lipoprotein NlpI
MDRSSGKTDAAGWPHSESWNGRMLTWLKLTFHFNVGGYHLAKRRLSEAAASFSEVIRLSPHHPAAYINRGVAFQGMNEHRRAISDFDRAIGFMSGLSPAHRTLAYFNRGISWKLIGDFDRAVADNMEVLARAPRFSAVYEELGTLAGFRYDFDAAIAHLDQAIRLAPRTASHYKARGLAKFARGSFTAAESDLRYSINIADDPYALLFWHLASCKMGRNAADEFESRAPRLNRQQWPAVVIALYLGKVDADAVRYAAANSDERAEAEFYIGEWHLLARRRDHALAALQVAAKSCPTWFMEHTAAVMELNRQGAPVSQVDGVS